MTAIACLVLALVGHRLAPHASLLVGVGNVVGFVAIHILPRWSVLSDPYPDVPVDAISWFGVAAPMLAAFWLDLLGLFHPISSANLRSTSRWAEMRAVTSASRASSCFFRSRPPA